MTDNTDLQFLEDNKRKVHIKDILSLILHNLHWLILCAAIGGIATTYHVRKQDRIYRSNATIIVRLNTANGKSNSVDEVGMGRFSGTLGRLTSTSIRNEILILQSKTTMLKVAKKLKLNQYYFCETSVVKRRKDLYKETPVEVVMEKENINDSFTMTITPQKDSTVVVQIGDLQPITSKYGKTIISPKGRFKVNATWYLTPDFEGVPITYVRTSLSDAADKFRYALNASYDESTTSVVTITLEDTNPQRAADIINETIKAYNEDVVRDRTTLLDYTNSYINNRLQALSSDLGSSQNEIASFKSSNSLLDVETYGQQYLEVTLQSNAEVDALQKQYSMAEYLQNQLRNGTNSPIAASVAIEDGAVTGVISQYNELAFQLSKYEQSGSGNNPAVRSLNSQIGTMKLNLIEILNTYKRTLDQRIKSARSQGLVADQKVKQAPRQQIYLGNVERLKNIKEELYKELLIKREDLMINQPAIEGSAKVVDEARVFTTPIAPDEKSWTTMGILIGLAFPVVVFFILKLLDTSVSSRRDIEDEVKIPFLGDIPSKPKKDERYIVIQNEKRDYISEAFRSLRTNIDYLVSHEGCKTYLMTSFLENSGKTFISSNAAVSYAILGKKVAIVDFDLRKGSIGKNMGKKHVQGISSFLAGMISTPAEIANTDENFSTLDWYFSGPIPPNPSELLSGKRMAEFMEYLKQNYEYIFLDCVPAGMVADVDIVKKYADATLFIIRAREFDKRMLPDLQKMYDDNKFPSLSIILNDVSMSKNGYGYGYGYGHRYGYGYGYGYGHRYGYGYGYGEEGEDGESGKHKHHRHHKSKDKQQKV